MNNTLLLASPRSGSNFLQSTICDASRMYRGGEFFTGGSDFNIYSINHLRNIYQYFFHNYKTAHALEIYQRMFEIMGSGEKEDKDRDALGPEHLSLMLGFIKDYPQQIWSHSLKQHVTKDKLFIKVFYNHYDYENHFDISEAIEMVDNLMVLHRENLLDQFISFRKAMKTNDWFRLRLGKKSNIKRKRKNKSDDAKIVWKLQDYFIFYEDHLKWAREYKKHISNFSHKTTAIIKYEDINNDNYQQSISKILTSNNLNCKLGDTYTKKQSKPADITDNFVNKEEFLDDYSKIKDKIILKIEDV